MLKQASEVSSIIKQINQAMARVIKQDLPFFSEIKSFTIKSGGKRVRSILSSLLSSSFGKLDNDVFDLSSIIEIIHAASLLHDDVLDNSSERRGKKSARKIFGNKEVILAGDYLLACAMKRLNDFSNPRLMSTFTEVIKDLSVAEILQMEALKTHNIDFKLYMKIIYGKTASLFEAACKAPAILNQLNEDKINDISLWGRNLGYLFQMRDDYLDYFYPEVLKKTPMEDYQNSQITWPFLVASSKFGIDLNEYFFRKPQENLPEKALQALHKSGAEEYCRREITERLNDLLEYIRSLASSWEISVILSQLEKLSLPSELPLGRR